MSNPTNPKKHVAAPDMIPEKPYGKNPPVPKRLKFLLEQVESKKIPKFYLNK